MREVISLHIGQAGIQIGNTSWELYCVEHGLMPDGTKKAEAGDINADAGSFFSQMSNGNYVPRAIMADLEPTVIDEVRNGTFKSLYNPSNLISGKEDAANNFARGYCTVGAEIIEKIMEPIRKMADSCEKLQGFLLFHSFGGGTGSGLNALLVDSLANEYQKKSQLEVAVFPSPMLSTAVVEPYNAVLTTDATLEYTSCAFLADNEAMYDICKNSLDIEHPSYSNLNRLLAQTVSFITASLRFGGVLNADFTDFQTNLVPFPRIHFPIMSFAPIVPYKNAAHETLSVSDLTIKVFDHSSRMLKCNNEGGHYVACCLLYRGDVAPKDINSAIAMVKNRKSVKFVEWSPTGFKVGINKRLPCTVPDGDIAPLQRAVCMLCNSTAMREAWVDINSKYCKMLNKKAFIHWYTSEGMEESEFSVAQQNLATLEEDYEQLTMDDFEVFDDEI